MITAPPIMDPRVNIVGVLYNAALAQYGAERLQAFVSNHESSMPDPHPKGQLLSRINQLFKSATLWLWLSRGYCLAVHDFPVPDCCALNGHRDRKNVV